LRSKRTGGAAVERVEEHVGHRVFLVRCCVSGSAFRVKVVHLGRSTCHAVSGHLLSSHRVSGLEEPGLEREMLPEGFGFPRVSGFGFRVSGFGFRD